MHDLHDRVVTIRVEHNAERSGFFCKDRVERVLPVV